MNQLETEFTLALMEAMREAQAVTGVAEKRLASQAEKLGGPEAVRQMLARGQTTSQFDALREKGRLELSVEALVIRGKFTALFSDQEADMCLSTLLEAGMF